MDNFTFFDLFYSLLLCIILYLRAVKKVTKLSSEKPFIEFYPKGLLAKFIAVYLFCSIYLFYYQGGDTLGYYESTKCMYKLFWHDIDSFLYVMKNKANTPGSWFKFTPETGWPKHYMFKDSRTFLIIKVCSVLIFPALGGFYSTSILLAAISYKWIWNAFEFTAERYPEIKKQIAFCFLYYPSVIFWGSGIMKDTFSFAATCFCLYGIQEIFIRKKNRLLNALQLLVAVYLIMSIKAYILFALLPGILIYTNFERIRSVKSNFLKIIILPLSITAIIFLVQTFFINFGDEFGKYSADRILEEAAIQQQDLTRDVYGKNSFDIGEFDPSLSGIVSKIPVAINAAIFRPYLWEVGSPTMLISAFENTILMVVIVVMLFKIGVFRFFNYLFKDPYLIFSLIFTITLAFGIGLSTANFGALVRYKIPFAPFFASMFFVINWYIKKSKGDPDYLKEDEEEQEKKLIVN